MVPETSWSAAKGTRYAGIATATSPVVASNASRSCGTITATTPPPNGPRKPPMYSGSVLVRTHESAPRHGAGLDDRGRRLAVGGEAIDDLLEVLDRAHVELHVEAVLAGHAVALDDLGSVLRDLRDGRNLARRGPHAQHGGE